MAFIKYEKGTNRRHLPNVTIGINQKGRFAFYKPVAQSYLKDAGYVELMYDPENKKIGIIPVSDVTENAFRIQGKTTKMIVAKKFLKKFKIKIENKRYEFDHDEQMLVIQV